jgi:hypothetical protein
MHAVPIEFETIFDTVTSHVYVSISRLGRDTKDQGPVAKSRAEPVRQLYRCSGDGEPALLAVQLN